MSEACFQQNVTDRCQLACRHAKARRAQQTLWQTTLSTASSRLQHACPQLLQHVGAEWQQALSMTPLPGHLIHGNAGGALSQSFCPLILTHRGRTCWLVCMQAPHCMHCHSLKMHSSFCVGAGLEHRTIAQVLLAAQAAHQTADLGSDSAPR